MKKIVSIFFLLAVIVTIIIIYAKPLGLGGVSVGAENERKASDLKADAAQGVLLDELRNKQNNSEEKMSRLEDIMEQQLLGQRELAQQLAGLLDAVSGVQGGLDGLGGKVSSLKGDMASANDKLVAYDKKLREFDNVLRSMEGSAAGLQAPALPAELDNFGATAKGEENTQEKLYQVEEDAFQKEVRNQSWATGVESHISTLFNDGSKHVALTDIACQASACRVEWSFRDAEGLDPNELMNLEHQFYLELAKEGLTTAIFNSSGSAGQNLAIFKRRDPTIPQPTR